MAYQSAFPADTGRSAVNEVTLWRRLLAELLGAVVVGPGIAAQRLSPGATGLELLENAAATAAGRLPDGSSCL